jgi:hypothetical protein
MVTATDTSWGAHIRPVRHGQQQAGRVGQPHGRHRERDCSDAHLSRQCQHDRREQHGGGIEVEDRGGDGREQHTQREQRQIVAARQARHPYRDHIEEARGGGQLGQDDDGAEEQ